MSTFDPAVRELLERAYPAPALDARGWPAVVQAAGAAHSVRRRRRRLLAVALALGAAVALGAFWPFSDGKEVVGRAFAARALAAVGDGPVLHVVVRLESPGWVVDLASGRRAKPYAIVEQWYEPRAGLREKVLRSNSGYVAGISARSSVEGSFVDLLRAFATRYEAVLRERRAEVLGNGTVFGRRVVWIRFRAGGGADPLAGSPAATPYDVALDELTYRPLYIRSPGSSGVRVLSIDTRSSIPRAVAAVPVPDESASLMYGEGLTGPLTAQAAATVLGKPGLWLGREFAGLPLAGLGGVSFAYGRAATFDEIKHRWRGINIVYGNVANESGFPDRSKPYIQLREQPAAEVAATGRSTPSPGTLLSYDLRRGHGAVVVGGVYVEIEAPNEQVLLAAARALRPQPAGG
jgi:hypothetical protein